MRAVLTDITGDWLPTIPNLTTVSMDHNKTRDGTSQIDTDDTGTSRNLREIDPVLITNAMNGTVMT